ncbi:hypothetical protein THAOC_30780 [Thalassiosira oceanica]|uniref:Uncharacterized protein n=1 Tax=Thalassiosira oceanica TaxID=159749 RepID=K0RN15_THAOC|nr:hypothetical protein THAOC_30780 [Thalassiosira oceanica]|eukprot:EJK50276.1 hypothetical protein THAOC_30780 [Thalassiosira oceanica]
MRSTATKNKASMSVPSMSKATKSVLSKIGKVGNLRQSTGPSIKPKPKDIKIHEFVQKDAIVVRSPKTSDVDLLPEINGSLLEDVFFEVADEFCDGGFETTARSSMSEFSREFPVQ